jgi:adenosine kinase
MKNYVEQCIKLKIPYLYDPAFQIESFSAEELRRGIEHAAICIGNDYEIELMQRKLDVTHDQLKKMVPILITTLGAKGSIVETKDELLEIPIAKVTEAVDPTGAGDAYRAGFIAGYLQKKSLSHFMCTCQVLSGKSHDSSSIDSLCFSCI